MGHSQEHVRYAGAMLDRRGLLHAAGAGWLGLTLGRLLEASKAHGQTRSPAASSTQSCILLYYYGGPSHLDTWDMKPAAPQEIRGEFRPIASRVPGIQVCEHLPRCAGVADRLAIVRSMHHPMRNHNAAAVESLCGRTPLGGDAELLADNRNAFPSYGSVLSWQRPGRRGVPAHVALPHVMYNVVQLPGQSAGFLGSAYDPFQVHRDPNRPDFAIDGLTLPDDLTLGRLDKRGTLLRRIESGTDRLGDLRQRAFDLIHSERVRRAFNVRRESSHVRDRYGRHKLGQSLLLARRLVEAGVRFINVNDKVRNGQLANWDSHQDNFDRLKNDLLPPADQAFSALIEDLNERGLLASTLVIAIAEFGRTPRINRNAGRDHWPDCFSIVLAGGGVRGGTVHGASDRDAAYPAVDPVTPADLAATIFWRFGLDLATEMHDLTGRPYRLADGEPMRRIFG